MSRNLTIEVKDQGYPEVLNGHITMSNGITPMCQIWYAYVKSYAPDTDVLEG